MTRRRRSTLLVGAVLVTVLVLIAAVVRFAGSEDSALAGASLLADGEGESISDIARGEVEDPSLADADVADVAGLAAGEQDRFHAVVGGPRDALVVRASATGAIESVGLTTLDLPGEAAFGVAPDGGVAVARNVGTEILVRGFDWTDEGFFRSRFEVGSIALEADRSMLLGSRREARIDAVAPDRTMRGLLGPVGSDALVVPDEPLGPIASLLRLPDDRVVFVADAQLLLLDETEVTPLDVPARVERIAPGPEGRVLTTGIGRDGDPVISVVDVDSGEVEELAVLEGVEPTIERPVSAAAVGDDLVFLADGKLWRLANAFG